MRERLRVWWIPQIGIKKTFYVKVNSVFEGKKLLDVLACYDLFQLENNVKPDYCNTGGLQCFDEDEQEWMDWYSEDGEDLDVYCDGEKSLSEYSEELFSQLDKRKSK